MPNYRHLSISVLKSNGLRHSKNPPVKFGFPSKIAPANIVKKLPPRRCSKPPLIPLFNFSHKRPTVAFTGKSGYTLGFQRKIAHSGLHGETCVPLMWRFWGSHAMLMVTGSRSKNLIFLKIVQEMTYLVRLCVSTARPISENFEADDGCRCDRNTTSRRSPHWRGGRYFYGIGHNQAAG